MIGGRRGDTSHKGSCCHRVDSGTGDWGTGQPTAIDLCGLGGPCLWGHLPHLTDYYRLCWDLALEKTPSTITLYGRDISNKIPISSEREKREERERKDFLESFRQWEAISFLSSPLLFCFFSFLHSSTLILLQFWNCTSGIYKTD